MALVSKIIQGVEFPTSTSVASELSGKIGPAGVTYEQLDSNGDVGTSAGQLAIGDHTHSGTYQPLKATVATKTSDYTLTGTDQDILADTTTNDITLTLPDQATEAGIVYEIIKTNAANTLNVACAGTDTFYDGTSVNAAYTADNSKLIVKSINNVWDIIFSDGETLT